MAVESVEKTGPAKIIAFPKPKLDPIPGDNVAVARMVAMLDAPLDQLPSHIRALVEVVQCGLDRMPQEV